MADVSVLSYADTIFGKDLLKTNNFPYLNEYKWPYHSTLENEAILW